jgi:hypothetical protein
MQASSSDPPKSDPQDSEQQPGAIRKACLICEQVLSLESDLEHCPKDGSLLILDVDCQSFDWLFLKHSAGKLRL